MEIRATKHSDFPQVDALLAASYPVLLKPDYAPSVLVTALPLISRARPELVSCGTYFGLWEDGSLRAAGGWTHGQPNGGSGSLGVGHIRHVVTNHRAVRRGFGRALMTHVLSSARASGVTRLECLSTHTAVGFYEAMGFIVRGDVDVPLRPGFSFPAIAMRLEFRS